jgi:hypothetical protein
MRIKKKPFIEQKKYMTSKLIWFFLIETPVQLFFNWSRS